MRGMILVLVLLSGCDGSLPHMPYNGPCTDGTCRSDPDGPEGWKTMAQDIWDYYRANTPFHGPELAPLKDTKWHWFVTGDDNTESFYAEGDSHVLGDTVVWPKVSGYEVSDIYIMDWGIKYGVLHHELLHAWLALSDSDSGGDASHLRSEWSTLLPQAVKDVPYAY